LTSKIPHLVATFENGKLAVDSLLDDALNESNQNLIF
jgi:Zn-dependent alcohol dehydrogenase